MRLKICGMKYPENIKAVAALQPDYMGFIFYKKSKRYFDGEIPEISDKIKRTGVFVNSSHDFILEKIKKYNLKAVQLHGEEKVSFCRELILLIGKSVEIIKVFSVDENFDFSETRRYNRYCHYYLYDTKGKERGGNGKRFDWRLLEKNKSTMPYFLSGGIGLEEESELKEFLNSDLSKYCIAIDVNSRFEDKPGLKNIKKLELLIKNIGL